MRLSKRASRRCSPRRACVVQLDSEWHLARAAADGWFAGEQQSLPALLLIVEAVGKVRRCGNLQRRSRAWRGGSSRPSRGGLRRSGHWIFHRRDAPRGIYPTASVRGSSQIRGWLAIARAGGAGAVLPRVAGFRLGGPQSRRGRKGALTMRWLQAGDISAASRPSIPRSSWCCRMRPDEVEGVLVERQQPARCDAFLANLVKADS
jgi:hypothetical protein